MKELNVICPHCKKNFNYYSSEFRPFCCEKCRLIDLGQWLNETYTVPAEKLNQEEIETIEQIKNEKSETSDQDDSIN
jgi:endogenous inhibitor of DNA gyrase (YacG/DUF329 family)